MLTIVKVGSKPSESKCTLKKATDPIAHFGVALF